MDAQGFPAGKRGITLHRWVPYGLLVVACALSAYAAFYVFTTAEERRRDQFFADAQETRNRIEVRLDTYVEVVRDGTALLAASNEIHLDLAVRLADGSPPVRWKLPAVAAVVRRSEPSARHPALSARAPDPTCHAQFPFS